MLPIVDLCYTLIKRGKFFSALKLLQQGSQRSPQSHALSQSSPMPSINLVNLTARFFENLSQTATSFQEVRGTELPQKTILIASLGWFIKRQNLVCKKLIKKGVLPVIMSAQMPEPLPLTGLTKDNYNQFKHKGVRLFDAAIYSVAIEREKGIAEIDVKDQEDWRTLSTQMQRVAAYVDYTHRMVAFYQPMRIIYAQGYMPASAVLRQIAIIENIALVALENTLHKQRVLYDTLSGISVNLNTIRNHFWRQRHLISDTTAQTFTEAYFDSIRSHKQAEHQAPGTPLDQLPTGTPSKVALYIGQVYTDSSILFGLNPCYKNQAEVIVHAANEIISRGHILIVKLHPKEKNGADPIHAHAYNQLTLRKLQSTPDFSPFLTHPDLIIDADNRYDTYDLIAKADYCLTINSQAGLEALLLGKAVILCGHSFYGGMGWTHDLKDKQDMGYLIDKIISTRSTPEKGLEEIQKFFYSYLNHACIDRNLDEFIQIFTQ